jgi:hypothetical protein
MLKNPIIQPDQVEYQDTRVGDACDRIHQKNFLITTLAGLC